MSRRPNGSDGPEDVDAAFAEIVAGLEREGLGAALLDDEDLTLDVSDQTDKIERPGRPDEPPTSAPTGWRMSGVEWDSVPIDEGHFVPPDPPPLPKPKLGTVFGALLLVIGIFLLAGPGLIGLAPRIATPLALISLAAGIGWLLLRMRHGPPTDGDDNGAQI